MLVEHFKIRDSSGNVIGVAARHWSGGGARPRTAWSVLIPSRGGLLLAAPRAKRAARSMRRSLKAGYHAGNAWNGTVALESRRTARTATVTTGSAEFEGLSGGYTEVWTVTGVSEDGELRGTIELNTVTRRKS